MSAVMEDQSLDRLLEGLNEAQRAAALHDDGPLLILAGAGTGKTTTLVHRVAAIIARGADPQRMMLLTFTRRAAAEMMRRVEAVLARWTTGGNASAQTVGRVAGRRLWGGTFHSVGTRLLKQHGHLIGLPDDFTILDRADSEDLMNQARGELNLAKETRRFPQKGTCFDIYSRCVNSLSPLAETLKTRFPWCVDHEGDLAALFQAYTARKERQHILDFDDLLLFWRAMLSDPVAGDAVRSKFDHVLVDEYQDTNAVQGEIVRRLCREGRGLTVVGDDAQSIYSFRAATVRNILDFPTEIPGTDMVRLEQNYRSTQPLLDATNAVIALATEGHRKTLWSKRLEGAKPRIASCLDENEQTDHVIETVLALREQGVPLKRQAALFRATHHSLALELELARRKIPFVKFGGLKFVEAAHVKDLLAFLRLAENPRDAVSATRVLLLFPGIGPKTADRLVRQLGDADGCFDVWTAAAVPSGASTHWPLFLLLMRQLDARRGSNTVDAPATSTADLPSQIAAVRRFYAPLLELRYDDATVRLRDLEQMEQLASRFADRATFLAELTLDPPASTQDLAADPLLDEEYMTLSTIHSAKGLEWDAVFLLHAADGNMPADLATSSPEEIEEERRLFYVALTRAKRHLTICHPQRYYFHPRGRSDQHSFSQLTRFLPPAIHDRFEKTTARRPDAAMGQGGVRPAVVGTDHVRAEITRLWG